MPIPKLKFPFWVITQRRDLMSLPVVPHDLPGYIAAFSTPQGATGYMVDRGETAWEFRLVSRSTFLDLITDLRRLGIRGVCLDPAPGDCGARMEFDALAGETA